MEKKLYLSLTITEDGQVVIDSKQENMSVIEVFGAIELFKIKVNQQFQMQEFEKIEEL